MELIIFIFIFYIILKKKGVTFSGATGMISLLNKALASQQFSNIKTMQNSRTLTLITADSHGENYIFALKNDGSPYSSTELDSIYDKANKFHFHNVVIINKDSILPSSYLGKKIIEYNFEVWSLTKLISLARPSTDKSSSYTKSVLRTSDTSYDNCKIDNTPVDPIQHGPDKSRSLFGNWLRKPNRL